MKTNFHFDLFNILFSIGKFIKKVSKMFDKIQAMLILQNKQNQNDS